MYKVPESAAPCSVPDITIHYTEERRFVALLVRARFEHLPPLLKLEACHLHVPGSFAANEQVVLLVLVPAHVLDGDIRDLTVARTRQTSAANRKSAVSGLGRKTIHPASATAPS